MEARAWGDPAYIDDVGHYFVAGRLKRMISVSGLKVWPAGRKPRLSRPAGDAGMLHRQGAVKARIADFARDRMAAGEIARGGLGRPCPAPAPARRTGGRRNRPHGGRRNDRSDPGPGIPPPGRVPASAPSGGSPSRISTRVSRGSPAFRAASPGRAGVGVSASLDPRAGVSLRQERLTSRMTSRPGRCCAAERGILLKTGATEVVSGARLLFLLSRPKAAAGA